MQLRGLLVRLLLGGHIAELLQGYRPPQGKHNSLITGSPTGWTWGKGDHGSELAGLLDDDHTQYLNNARHDVVARHPLSVLAVEIGKRGTETLQNSNDGTRTIPEQSWTKKKECKLNAALAGCRIKFKLWCNSPGAAEQRTYGRIYKNGEAIGTIRNVMSKNGYSEEATFSEDFLDFAVNDLIQIYCYGTWGNANYHKVSNMRFYYSDCFTKLFTKTMERPEYAEIETSPISITNQDP